MFDLLDGNKERSFTPEKLLTISAAGMLLGFGLCGAGLATVRIEIATPFLVAASVAFWGSALGLVVGALWVVLQMLTGRGRG